MIGCQIVAWRDCTFTADSELCDFGEEDLIATDPEEPWVFCNLVTNAWA